MKRKKLDIWYSQIMSRIQSLRFSCLDEETQRCVSGEMLFFNKRRFTALCWSILVIEVLNLSNVLFLSRSGLESVNNRQYFAMYLLLMAGAAACLAATRLLQCKTELLRRFYVGFMLFWVLWCALLSAMDLRSNPNITVFITGVFVLACLARLKPWESISILTGGLIVFFSLSWRNITNGSLMNAIIVTLTAALISCSRYFAALEELRYRQKLIRQADRQSENKERLELLMEQEQALLDCSRDNLFLWDRETGTLTVSGSRGTEHLKESKPAVLQWLETKRGETTGLIKLGREDESGGSCYKIEVIWQMNSENEPAGAVGSLTSCTAEPD